MKPRPNEPCKSHEEPEVEFFHSGWQCFLEQRPDRSCSVDEFARDAFYAGAALLFTGMRRFQEVYENEPEIGMQKIDMVLEEVYHYLAERGVTLEWEPRPMHGQV